MNPEQLAKNTEHSQQVAFFCWLQQNFQQYPQLQMFFAIPNGGERNIAVASRLKAEGVRMGVPDTFLPVPKISNGQVLYHGLWIEFKRPKSEDKPAGRLSKDQERWREWLLSQNYCYKVAFDYGQAIEATLDYLSN